jgi:CheY-like chemotaxis protein
MKLLILNDDADDRLLLREYLQNYGLAVAEVINGKDDDQVRSITRDILEGYGYRVNEAEDGEAAVDQFTHHASRCSPPF